VNGIEAAISMLENLLKWSDRISQDEICEIKEIILILKRELKD